MYSILIVDDERFMREGIARLLPWSELGIDYVDTAGSGTKALERMQEHMPDIVLTDIEMKNMNGLQLIRQMNEINPNLRIIVLTGHDDFSYVQECCRMDVHDYLLKPVEPEQLAEAIRVQIGQYRELAEKRSRQQLLERVRGLSEQMRVETLFRNFFHREAVTDEIRLLLLQSGWNEPEPMQIAVITPESGVDNEWDRQRELLDLSVNSTCISMVEYRGVGLTFRDENNALILLLFCGTGRKKVGDILGEIQAVLQSEYDVAGEVYLGEAASCIAELPDSYESAKKLWEMKRCRRSVIVQASAEVETDDEVRLLVREIEANLKRPKHAMGLYGEFWHKLTDGRWEEEVCRKEWVHAMTDIYLAQLTEAKAVPAEALTELLMTAQETDFSDLGRVGIHFLETVLGTAGPAADDVIGNAKYYIDNHLEEDLSVTKLAEQFYLSVAYFSKLFKKTEGIGCNYYIMRQRMERAKVLLGRRSQKVLEVAEQVGYRDVNYFSLTFKKYTGVSPAEYRGH